jgi:hypothetical protein
MSEETKAVVMVLAAGGGLLLMIVAQVLVFMKLVRGWVDKAMAKHYFYEHVLDHGSGETIKTRLIRCDNNCPVLHPKPGTGGRYEHISRGRG